jgi:hypothetical protein
MKAIHFDYVRRLERRARHLEERMSDKDTGYSYDQSELCALQWAILELKRLCEERKHERDLQAVYGVRPGSIRGQ